MIMVVADIMPVVGTRCSVVVTGGRMHIGRGMRVAKRHIVSVHIAAILYVVDGVSAPVSMISFPAMKTSQTGCIHNQPDMVRTQIIILIPNYADIFSAIPDIIIGNPYIYGDYRCRDSHNRRTDHN